MTFTLLKTGANLKMALLSVDELRPHEKGSQLYLELLKRELLRDGVLRYPIIVDEKSRVILDGMHRWLALKSLGYTLIPVILVDVSGSIKIRVGRRRIHQYTNDSSEEMSIEGIISAGLNGHLMEMRSTRHFFPFSKFQQVNYPLHLLGKRAAQDVSGYLSETAKDDGYLIIKEWLEEISEELEFLKKRKEEVEKEKEDFLNRVKSLERSFEFG